MTTYAINGLGRIGKLALRPLVESGAKIAFLNDAVGDPEMHAHLLEFDTVHGRWDAEFSYDEDTISINGTTLPLCNTRNLEELPLNDVDVVIDCTGAFKTEAKLAPLQSRCEESYRLCPCQRRKCGEHRLWRQQPRLRCKHAKHHYGGVLHNQLPRACGQGDP